MQEQRLLKKALDALLAAKVAPALCAEIEVALGLKQAAARPSYAEAVATVREHAQAAAQKATVKNPKSKAAQWLWQLERALDRKALAAALWLFGVESATVPRAQAPDEDAGRGYDWTGTRSLGWAGAVRAGLVAKDEDLYRLTPLGLAVGVLFVNADLVALENLATLTWASVLSAAERRR